VEGPERPNQEVEVPTAAKTAARDDVRELPLESLTIGPGQVRVRGVDTDLDELVESIRIHGLLEPIVVTPAGTNAYEVVSGQRRYLAYQKLGKRAILAVVLSSIDELTARVLSLTENLIRKDVDAKDLVDVCTSLFKKYGTALAVSQETGIPYAKVRKYVKYERLIPQLRELFDKGEMSLDSALTTQDLATDPSTKEIDATLALRIAHKIGKCSSRQLSDLRKRAQRTGPIVEDELRKLVDEPPPSSGPMAQTVRHRIVISLSAAEMNGLLSYAKRSGLEPDEAAREAILEMTRATTSARTSSPWRGAKARV
jgi:ParB family chromosome partitioning protein